MRFQALFFLLLLTCMYLSVAQGSYGNCCLRYSQGVEKVHIKMVRRYWIQETDGDCNLRAVVLVLKSNPRNKGTRTVCADPNNDRIKKLLTRLPDLNIRRE